ncbi:mitochondrial uncoupling protein 4 [Sarcoptes scabiei]|nr:mitochondrial uncoupling protein 4 [Sarcoptes scabiei]
MSTEQSNDRIIGAWVVPSKPIPKSGRIGSSMIMKTTSNTRSMYCGFCKNNGEPEEVYRSHFKMVNGKVNCPILRQYRCTICDATGDYAHTRSYCPLRTTLNGTGIFGPDLFFNMSALKKDPFNAAGHRNPAYPYNANISN